MPFDFQAAVSKQYTALPVTSGLIPSRGVPEPQVMWVGCSDSLICETETLGVLPEEIFVHRNLGNIISNEDLSSKSAVEWCVDLLKVKHIVVCGHYDCALIKEGPGADALHGWYKDVTKLHNANEKFLASTQWRMNANSRDHRFEEVYVLAEVDWLRRQPIVKKAIHDRGLRVHAFVYNKETNSCVRLIEAGGDDS